MASLAAFNNQEQQYRAMNNKINSTIESLEDARRLLNNSLSRLNTSHNNIERQAIPRINGIITAINTEIGFLNSVLQTSGTRLTAIDNARTDARNAANQAASSTSSNTSTSSTSSTTSSNTSSSSTSSSTNSSKTTTQTTSNNTRTAGASKM